MLLCCLLHFKIIIRYYIYIECPSMRSIRMRPQLITCAAIHAPADRPRRQQSTARWRRSFGSHAEWPPVLHLPDEEQNHGCVKATTPRLTTTVTFQHVHVHRLRIGVRRLARVLARVRNAGPLNEQTRRRGLAQLSDHRNTAACRVKVDVLQGVEILYIYK